MGRFHQILNYLILSLFASLFLPFEILKTLLLVVLFIYTLSVPAVRVPLKWSALPKWTLWMAAFIAWLLISLILSENKGEGIRFLEKRAPLLLIPFSLGLVRITHSQRQSLLISIAWMVSFFCLYALIRSGIQYADTGLSGYMYNDSLSIHLGQQSIYTSLFVNASIFIFGWHLFQNHTTRQQKTLYIAALVFLFFISFLLASRNMMIILYCSIIILAIIHIVRRRLYLQGALLLAGLIVGVFLVYSIFPKTLNRFKELTVTQFRYDSRAAESHYDGTFSPDQWNGANFRLAAWSCGWQLFKENPILGTGIGDKRVELNRIYRDRDFHFAIETRKNVHNNYLDILYSTGLIGLIIFLIAWAILPFIRFYRNRDTLAMLIHITALFAMITEVYFDRSLGPFSFAGWLCLLLTCNPLNKKN